MFDKNLLFSFLKEGPKSFQKLTQKFGISKSQNNHFSKWILSFTEQKIILQTNDRDYFLPIFKETSQGVIRMNKRGFGFVDILSDNIMQTIFIAPSNTLSAMDNDLVELKIFQEPKKTNSYQGVITKIIKRNREIFVGTLNYQYGKFVIIPFDPKVNGEFQFLTTKNLVHNHVVKVKIVAYGQKASLLQVVKFLGHKDKPFVDIWTAVEDANISSKFDEDVMNEIKKIPSSVVPGDFFKRKDLRSHFVVTIDGNDTKDFDDAIEVEKLPNNNYRLAVHIADVSHYVKQDSFLDKEAFKRGTSVYLANLVIPMLPPFLSNGVCSLNPNVDRLTVTCETEIDDKGKSINSNVFLSVINSKQRLTYDEVNKYYKKESELKDKPFLSEFLDNAKNLSDILMAYKKRQGFIDFDIEEAKIVLDDKGCTTDVIINKRWIAEVLIENFMIRANETVASFLAKSLKPSLFRTHEKPSDEKIIQLQEVSKLLGLNIQIQNQPSPLEFSNAVEKIKKHRFDDFVKIMMLRTMSKAKYSQKNIGHFGLASKNYTHFTSPIRRYPDLIVHRLLKLYFLKNDEFSNQPLNNLSSIATQSSTTEQKAMDVERKVMDIKKAEFYKKFIGNCLTGTIVSVTNFGFFVEFADKVNGLVHVSTLLDDNYKLASNGFSLFSNARKFQVGESVEVVVASISKNEGKVSLVLKEFFKDWKRVNSFKEKGS